MKSNLNIWLQKNVAVSFVGPAATVVHGKLHQVDDVGVYIFSGKKNVFIPFTSILCMALEE